MDAIEREYRVSIPLFFLVLAILSYVALGDSYAREVLGQLKGQLMHSHDQGESINAALSVVKALRIKVEPMGVGLSIPLGQALDPLDLLSERYTLAILIAMISIETYDFLLEFLSSWSFATTVALFFFIAAILFASGYRCMTMYRCVIFMAMVRFIFSLAIICTGEVYSGFFHASYVHARQQLETVTLTLEEQSQQLVPEKAVGKQGSEESYVDQLMQGLAASYDSAKAAAGSIVGFPARVKSTITTYMEVADELRVTLLSLMKMFVIVSCVLPPLLTLLLWLGASRLFVTQSPGSFCSETGQ